MSVTDSGIEIYCNCVQSLNASSSIMVTPSSRFTYFRLVSPSNALLVTFLRLDGSVISTNPE